MLSNLAEAGSIKSLSDLKGIDVHVHHGTVNGLFREIGNVLRRRDAGSSGQPTIREMHTIYRELIAELPEIQRSTGARSAFERQSFLALIVSAVEATQAERG